LYGKKILIKKYINKIGMVRSTPLLRKRIEHKRTARFTRFQSDLYGGRLAASWRRPRGIDPF